MEVVLLSCTIDEVLYFLQRKTRDWISEPSQLIFGVSASKFLEFAIEDSKISSIHGRVNSLSNIKRAVECRIDELLYALCLQVKSNKDKWDFPKKIQVLGDLGMLAPPILTKINRKRNQLEHQYVEPTQDDVDDALGVTTLFFGYTDRFSRKGPIIETRCTSENLLNIERKNGIITIKEGGGLRKLNIGDEDGWLEVAKILASLWTKHN